MIRLRFPELVLLPGLLLFSLLVSADQSPVAVFDRVWEAAEAGIYPRQRASSHFTEARRLDLRQRAMSVSDLPALAATVVNPFLATLGVSHTELYTERDLEYVLLRSLFSSRDLHIPAVWHAGMQVTMTTVGPRVRAVFEGSPAAAAGLRRGDLILGVDGAPPSEGAVFEDGRSRRLEVERSGLRLTLSLTPTFGSPHAAMVEATSRSLRWLERDGRRLGYLRLWSGTHPRFLEVMRAALEGELAAADGLILDLRDGMGGAWYDYLDPFFADREDFFVAARIGADGAPHPLELPLRSEARAFAGPMVVLINEGTRSGKEALAYQFRKSGRATLVGTRSAGAFATGRGLFADEDAGYLLYLAAGEILLDGHRIEGIGIDPHHHVPWPLEAAAGDDPQLQRALDLLEEELP